MEDDRYIPQRTKPYEIAGWIKQYIYSETRLERDFVHFIDTILKGFFVFDTKTWLSGTFEADAQEASWALVKTQQHNLFKKYDRNLSILRDLIQWIWFISHRLIYHVTTVKSRYFTSYYVTSWYYSYYINHIHWINDYKIHILHFLRNVRLSPESPFLIFHILSAVFFCVWKQMEST